MDIKAMLGMQLPGEQIIAAIINAAAKHREGMSDENRARHDALTIKIQEDAYAVWRRFWVRAGVLEGDANAGIK